MIELLRKYPSLSGLFFLFLIITIPIASALSSVTDAFSNSSKVSGTYQTVVTGGHVELDQYNASLGLVGYESVRKITIDHNDIGEVLTDFPILVHLNSSNIDWSKVQDDLDDLRFTQDNSTLLMAELDNSVINSEAWIWVKIPSLSNVTDTELFIFYNNPSASSYWNPESVWDASSVMVQHMNDATTSTILDSTSNDNDGAKKGANEPIVTTSGKVGNAQDFDGANDYLKVLNHASLNSTSLTFSVWFYPNTVAGNKWMVDKGYGVAYAFLMSGNELQFYTGGSPTVYNPISANVWYHTAGTYDGVNRKLYINGVLRDTDAGALNVNANDLYIGSNNAHNEFFDGVIDKIQISNVARSSAWILASYESERDHFLTYGPEENIQMIYYDSGLAYSTNLLLATSSSKIDSFIYNATIINPGTIRIQFSENNVTWQNQFGISNVWTSFTDGQHTLDMFNLEWSNHFYYRINMTQTSVTVSPSLNEISVYYLADSTPAGTVQAIFSELFYGAGSWLGLLILLVFIVALCLAQRYLGLLMLPVAIYLGIEYLTYPTLMWNALIMFLASIFILMNLFRKRD